MNITIVGGGFGGVKAALELSKYRKNRVTLISDKSSFQYYPALYGTATGRSHLQSWVPLGQIFAGRYNVEVVLDKIKKIDKVGHVLTSVSGKQYRYQTLVLALGSVTTYFGIEGLNTYAYGIKSSDEIKKLKEHLAYEFEHPAELDKRIVIIGAGPTGVELSASLGSYLEHLQKYFYTSNKKVSIDLVEAAPRILPRMSEKASAIVLARLKALGVNVETGKTVERETADALMVSGKPIKSHTVIWTSGVANNPFFAENADQFELAKNGRVIVDEYMRSGRNVYVIGDNAVTKFGGLAQTALHDAIYVSKNIMRRTPKPYKPVQPPVVVPVGEGWAVFEYKKILVSGSLASFIRSVADYIGYHDILPIGQALGVWRTHRIYEDSYYSSAEEPGFNS